MGRWQRWWRFRSTPGHYHEQHGTRSRHPHCGPFSYTPIEKHTPASASKCKHSAPQPAPKHRKETPPHFISEIYSRKIRRLYVGLPIHVRDVGPVSDGGQSLFRHGSVG